MTVYELIQELAQYDANAEVRIKAKMGEFTVDCTECETTVDVDGDVFDMSVDSVGRNGKVIEIYCED